MTALALSPNPSLGLEHLVAQADNLSSDAPKETWDSWIQATMLALETDDSVDSRLTDQLADCLMEVEDALAEGYGVRPAINRLRSLYHQHLESQPLEQLWRGRAAGLGTAQLSSPTWDGLLAALDTVARGGHQRVAAWVDQVEDYFLGCWEEYEGGDILDSEITTESVLCHQFLREGTELWLEALATLREGLNSELNRRVVLQLAEEGQRHLVLVQLIHDEIEHQANQVLAWARN